MRNIKSFDIYRKIPKDITQPTVAGAVISITCFLFILFMIINDIKAYLHIELKTEIIVDDPGREGRMLAFINITVPHVKCDIVGIDIQDDNGRHEVGSSATQKVEIVDTRGCRLEGTLNLSKADGNFHVSTHGSVDQPDILNMFHVIQSVRFGNLSKGDHQYGSFNPLENQSRLRSVDRSSHEYFLKIVPTIYTDLSGVQTNNYQYTFAHRTFQEFHHTGKSMPAIWFKYQLLPFTVIQTETRQSFYEFITNIFAVVGGTFTVAGLIDTFFFNVSEMLKKQSLGKLT